MVDEDFEVDGEEGLLLERGPERAPERVREEAYLMRAIRSTTVKSESTRTMATLAASEGHRLQLKRESRL